MNLSATFIEPAAPTPLRVGAASSEVPECRRPVRVVIADDHRIVRAGLVALLATSSEIEVVGLAADGIEAIELAETLEPDVVVMDVTMPRLNGIDATRRLHRQRPEMRVIGLSMHDSREILEAMLHAGASRFITKGGPPQSVIDAILDRDGRN